GHVIHPAQDCKNWNLAFAWVRFGLEVKMSPVGPRWVCSGGTHARHPWRAPLRGGRSFAAPVQIGSPCRFVEPERVRPRALSAKKENGPTGPIFFFGGEGGIRTRDT